MEIGLLWSSVQIAIRSSPNPKKLGLTGSLESTFIHAAVAQNLENTQKTENTASC